MKQRRLLALCSAGVLALGMVSSVSAHDNEFCDDAIKTASVDWQCPPSEEPSSEPTAQAPSDEPTWAPSDEPSWAPSEEPSSEASEAPSEAPSTEPSTEAPSTEPSATGAVEGLTSQPTLPPTDALSAGDQGGPDVSLPLALMILGTIGLGAVALSPKRAKR
jgi:hypothetical protein